MPADIVGTQVWRPSTERFDTELGPVFANLVLADEINRAPAKVQSALLEAMAERQVSIGGTTHRLPSPFLVLATQNPIETEGVYTLPEAQRDRFLLKVDVDHADELDELTIVQRMSVDPPRAEPVLTVEELVELQAVTDRVFVHHAVAHYVVQLVMATRHPDRYGLALAGVLEYGVSARGTLGLVAAARALALLRGRDYVLPHDVVDIAGDVLAHRLVLSFDAVAEGVDPRSIVQTDPGRGAQAAGRAGRPGPRSMRTRTRAPRRAAVAVVEAPPVRPLPRFRGLDLTVQRRLDGLLHGDHAGLRLGPGHRARRSWPATSRATTSAGSTGTSPPGPASRTCG